ncbi:flagellar biosynthesis protein FlhB [Clostridium sp. D2Q-14]|uniref:flagellar biosynthesis protein FlhB n=1 Tax=Anaeromonas gelatinilytica TaxID=2683194 RepID=UPI00193C2C74|nr:flagellar biosynthesis protein FlhB [Anaeromonas gelatinilytica]MBS4536035.1 flagellar biosynthesis protein FlhB [Anaeromonas gelatinilytica]
MNKYFIDLQLFASEEKTEKPTAKKRKEAREKGQVLKSRELTSAFLLIFAFLSLRIFGKYMLENLHDFTVMIFSDDNIYKSLYTVENLSIFFMNMIIITGKIVAPIIGTVFVMAIVINYLQVGFLFTTKTLNVKISRINPIEGFKKIFSTKSLVELIKATIKIFIIGYVVISYVRNNMNIIYNLFNMEINEITKNIGSLTFGIAIRSGGILLLLAIFDYWYQWWQHEKNLKMTKQEIKQEHKQSDGDPLIKSKIKEKQRQIAMKRMMQDVPKADVIITNPTHYAIALEYNNEKYEAPYVLAKGKDIVAQKIKEIAKDSDVPMVENKLLARSLYSSCEVGDSIPEELYQAVAEVLAYVYSLK